MTLVPVSHLSQAYRWQVKGLRCLLRKIIGATIEVAPTGGRALGAWSVVRSEPICFLFVTNYQQNGSGCGKAVDHTPCFQEVKGFRPAGCLDFFFCLNFSVLKENLKVFATNISMKIYEKYTLSIATRYKQAGPTGYRIDR